MRRYVPLLIAGAVLIAAACSDSVAPTRSTVDSNLPTVSVLGYSSVSYSRANPSAEAKGRTQVFKMSPRGGVARFGSFSLKYPAQAVCDPIKSDYGPTEWKKDCATIRHLTTVRVKYWVEDGRLHSDFEPDIRFNPNVIVTLSTYVPAVAGSTLSDEELQALYGMGYSTRHGNDRLLINDFVDDPSLLSAFNRNTGKVSRRVYHFSGYYVRSGKYCEDGSLDPECILDPLITF